MLTTLLLEEPESDLNEMPAARINTPSYQENGKRFERLKMLMHYNVDVPASEEFVSASICW